MNSVPLDSRPTRSDSDLDIVVWFAVTFVEMYLIQSTHYSVIIEKLKTNYIYQSTRRENISSRFSRNSEAYNSEFLESLEESLS